MVRVTPGDKRLMTRCAEREGETLSTWLRRLALQRINMLKLTIC